MAESRSRHRGTYVTLTVKVKLDDSGFGTFSTPHSAVESVQQILEHQIPHYKPTVQLLQDHARNQL